MICLTKSSLQRYTYFYNWSNFSINIFINAIKKILVIQNKEQKTKALDADLKPI